MPIISQFVYTISLTVNVYYAATKVRRYTFQPTPQIGGANKIAALSRRLWTSTICKLTKCLLIKTLTTAQSLVKELYKTSGMTNYRIGPHRTTSDYIGPHRTTSDRIGPHRITSDQI